jgi:guanylate kinase
VASGPSKGKGLIFIISAPSGTGKTTLVKRVMEDVPGLRFSVSYTTRPPRAGEQEGEDYHFVSPAVFQEMVKKGEFLEWAEVLGSRYGTPRVDLKALAAEEIDLILDIDTQGAKKVREKVDSPVLIYLLPPSLEDLEGRLVKRDLDSPERIKFRMANAQKDMKEARQYHYVIVNDRLEEAAEKLKAIIFSERDRKRKESILEERKKKKRR